MNKNKRIYLIIFVCLIFFLLIIFNILFKSQKDILLDPLLNRPKKLNGSEDKKIVVMGYNNSGLSYYGLMDIPTGKLLVNNNISDSNSNVFNKYGLLAESLVGIRDYLEDYLSKESFSGIDAEDTEKEVKILNILAFSKDRKSAFFSLEILDSVKWGQYNPDNPRSIYPLLREENYFCDFLKKECTITDIKNLIFNIFSKRFSDKKSISLDHRIFNLMNCIFDSEKNILYGHIFDATTYLDAAGYTRYLDATTRYLFAFDLNDQEKTQFLNLNIFNSNTSIISFSPNLNKFAVFEPRYDDIINGNYKKILWLYSTDDFANPIKKIDLSSFLDLSPHQITWSKDEKKIALDSISHREFDIRGIFVIDLDNDQVSQIYNKQLTDMDNFRGTDFRLFLEGFSESGKYLIFQERVEIFDNWILKAFDVQENKEIELFKGYLDVLATF